MARSPTGRAALTGPQAWDGNGRFIARRPFRLSGVMYLRGEEVPMAAAGSRQQMRRLVQSHHVACILPGLDIPAALALPREGQDGDPPAPATDAPPALPDPLSAAQDGPPPLTDEEAHELAAMLASSPATSGPDPVRDALVAIKAAHTPPAAPAKPKAPKAPKNATPADATASG